MALLPVLPYQWAKVAQTADSRALRAVGFILAAIGGVTYSRGAGTVRASLDLNAGKQNDSTISALTDDRGRLRCLSCLSA